MDAASNAATVGNAFRIFSNLFTLVCVYGWVRFADYREGSLERPSLHHRVWLQVLIIFSALGALLGALAVAADFGWPKV